MRRRGSFEGRQSALESSRVIYDLVEASYLAAASAVLTIFGFMHGETVGIAVTPSVALAYAMAAALLFALSRAPAEAAVPSGAESKMVPAE